jgi:hypothetical protein
MQTWNDSLHLTKEKLLDTLNQNFVSLTPSDEEKTGADGEQLVRNIPTGWNGRGGENTPSYPTLQLTGANSLYPCVYIFFKVQLGDYRFFPDEWFFIVSQHLIYDSYFGFRE